MSARTSKTAGEDDAALGLKIKARRKELGLSQSDLSSSIGISFQQVQKYENGANRIPSARLIQIARTLNTTVEALCEGLTHGSLSDGLEGDHDGDGRGELLAIWGRLSPTARRALIEISRELTKTSTGSE